MNNKYYQWHDLKTKINDKTRSIFFREMEVWWCSLGANVGDEEDGKNDLFERPVLILKKFNRQIFLGFPLTSKIKTGKYYHSITLGNFERTIILSQIRLFSTKRLIRRVGKITDNQFQSVLKAFIEIINEPQ